MSRFKEPPRVPVANRLLAALPPPEYQRLSPYLKSVALPFGEVIYELGATIRHVYFPNQSVVSLISTAAGRTSLEVGLVGSEGLVGLPVYLGVTTSRNRAIVQGAGTALRMKAEVLRREARGAGPLPRLLLRYTHGLLAQISQSAVCNQFHQVEARLARWLLMTQDRVGADEFRLTQEFIAAMLGVRREGVSKIASRLQQQRLISFVRGEIRVLDRRRLEAQACECYGIIKAEYDGFLGPSQAGRPSVAERGLAAGASGGSR